MSAALGLYRLQQVDSQMDQIRARLKSIDEILRNDFEARNATDVLITSESRLADAERMLRSSDAEVEKQKIKIQQTEASLYGGAVHNPKELQDLQQDVISLKRHLETLEERELDTMTAVELAEADVNTAAGTLEKIKTDRSSQNSDLTKQGAALQRELERLESEREAIASNISADAFALYNQLREQRRGVAVALISDASCAACGTTLTPSQQQNARSTTHMFNCPTCGRILFAN